MRVWRTMLLRLAQACAGREEDAFGYFGAHNQSLVDDLHDSDCLPHQTVRGISFSNPEIHATPRLLSACSQVVVGVGYEPYEFPDPRTFV